MSSSTTSLKELRQEGLDAHTGFTQNTHKDTTCSAVGSILVRLEATLGKPDLSNEYFRGFVAECVELKLLDPKEEEEFYTKIIALINRSEVINDDDKLKIFHSETNSYEEISIKLRTVLSLVIMSLDDRDGFIPGVELLEVKKQLIDNLRFVFDTPKFCNTGVRNSLVEILHKQYRFLETDGSRRQVAYVLSDLGSDVEGVLRQYFTEALACKLLSNEKNSREQGYRLLTRWIRDDLNQIQEASDLEALLDSWDPLSHDINEFLKEYFLSRGISDEAQQKEISNHIDYLLFRKKRPHVKEELSGRCKAFFEGLGVSTTHPEILSAINLRVHHFDELEHPDVPQLSAEIQLLLTFWSQFSEFPEATRAQVLNCSELSTAAAVIRPDFRQHTLIRQAKRYAERLPFGEAEAALIEVSRTCLQSVLTLDPESPADERFKKISAWEDQLSQAHLRACQDDNSDIINNSFGHLFLLSNEDILSFIRILDELLQRPCTQISEKHLRTLLESLAKTGEGVVLKLSPLAVNSILWFALRTSPLDWSIEFQDLMYRLIGEFEKPQKHYNDQKWVEHSYPQAFIVQLKWLLECARNQEMRDMPNELYMTCSIKGFERSQIFKDRIQEPTFFMRGWFLDVPLDHSWDMKKKYAILMMSLPSQCQNMAVEILRKDPTKLEVFGAVWHLPTLESVILSTWDLVGDGPILGLIHACIPFLSNQFVLQSVKKWHDPTYCILGLLQTNMTITSLEYILNRSFELPEDYTFFNIMIWGCLSRFKGKGVKSWEVIFDRVTGKFPDFKLPILTYLQEKRPLMSPQMEQRYLLVVKQYLFDYCMQDLADNPQTDSTEDRLSGCFAKLIYRLKRIGKILLETDKLAPFVDASDIFYFLRGIETNLLGKLFEFNPRMVSEGFEFDPHTVSEEENFFLLHYHTILDLVGQAHMLSIFDEEQERIDDYQRCISTLLSSSFEESKRAVQAERQDFTRPLPEPLNRIVGKLRYDLLDFDSQLAARGEDDFHDVGWGELFEIYELDSTLHPTPSGLIDLHKALEASPHQPLTLKTQVALLLLAVTTPLDQWPTPLTHLVIIIFECGGEAFRPLMSSCKNLLDLQSQLKSMIYQLRGRIEDNRVDTSVVPYTMSLQWQAQNVEEAVTLLKNQSVQWVGIHEALDPHVVEIINTKLACFIDALLNLPVKKQVALVERYRDRIENNGTILYLLRRLPCSAYIRNIQNSRLLKEMNDYCWISEFLDLYRRKEIPTLLELIQLMPPVFWERANQGDDQAFLAQTIEAVCSTISAGLLLNKLPLESVYHYLVLYSDRKESTPFDFFFKQCLPSVLALMKRVKTLGPSLVMQEVEEWRQSILEQSQYFVSKTSPVLASRVQDVDASSDDDLSEEEGPIPEGNFG